MWSVATLPPVVEWFLFHISLPEPLLGPAFLWVEPSMRNVKGNAGRVRNMQERWEKWERVEKCLTTKGCSGLSCPLAPLWSAPSTRERGQPAKHSGFAPSGSIKEGPTILTHCTKYLILIKFTGFHCFKTQKSWQHEGTNRIYTMHHLRSSALHQNLMMGSKFSQLTTKRSIDCL